MVIVAQESSIRAIQPDLLLVVRRLLRGAMDTTSHLGAAFDRRALAQAADSIHDRSLDRLVYVAALGAQEAHVRGCGCELRFDRVIRLGQGAQQADAVEDGQYDLAFGEVGQGEHGLRRVAATAEGLILGAQA